MNTTVFTIQQESDPITRHNHTGTYFRLVHEPDAEAKQLAYEKMIAPLQSGEIPSGLYQVAQGRFDAIPGSPWVYWALEKIRLMFDELPSLDEVASPRAGMHGGDRFRYAKYWWEVGETNIGFNCQDKDEAFNSGKTWFPYMKGGSHRKWFGNQEWVVAFDRKHFKILSEVGNRLPSRQFYFLEGITYSAVTSGDFSARISPGGYLFDAGGSSLFPENLLLTLACLNSGLINAILDVLNPTVNIQAGDIKRLPIPTHTNSEVENCTKKAIQAMKSFDTNDENTYNFITPWEWKIRKASIQSLYLMIERLESRIQDNVYNLYGLSNNEITSITENLIGEFNEDIELDNGSNDHQEDAKNYIDDQGLATRLISYAVGVTLKRFKPGFNLSLGNAIYRQDDFAIGSLQAPDEAEFNELVGTPEQFTYIDNEGGRHVFSAEIEQALRELALPDGIAVLDEGHPCDLKARVEKALVLMLGEADTREVIREATGDSSSASLRKFLERDFFTKWHMKWYKKRPVYWPIQSPNRGYGFVILHEKITKDTFFAIQRKPFLESKINAVTFHLEEIEDLLRSAQGVKRKSLEKQLDQTRKLADELAEFSQTLERITLGSDDLPGYTPEDNWIDDGVILRMAPLWEVIPVWKSEPKKYWERLESGQYDWSHIAMHYWPKQCQEKCKTNKSFAIAHGHEELYEGM